MISNEQEDFEESTEEIEIRECSQICLDNAISCHFSDCKHWINYRTDNNCDLVAIKKNGPLTLRQVGERLGVSYVRIKQIEDNAIKKIRKSVPLDKLQD
jgi:hypothetical protein